MQQAPEYWQHYEAAALPRPWTHTAPIRMPDGRFLWLPLRDYGEVAVTGFISNQASFTVLRPIVAWMAEAARAWGAEAVVGLPTLGHVFGGPVAEVLGHPNWVAPGYSRKKWYDEAYSVPTSSSTAPDARRMWLDPRLLHRVQGKRVLLVDDVISTGSSALAGLALLQTAGARPVGLCVAMAQGDRWRAAWPLDVPVAAAFATPLFRRRDGGWEPDDTTRADVLLPKESAP
ncbi:phosphoribosyl transferase domain protein [Acetobacteraceae bacterium AT-5844]|nr:phosphoribosyl transferase domain protein [Acetobacteraceae bacterium AT-5844]